MGSLATKNTKSTETWPRVRLGDVCVINLGKTPPRGDKRYWDKEKVSGVRWLSIADLAETEDGFVNESKEYITREAIVQCGVPKVKAGTFLLSFKLTLGRTAIAGCDLCTNEAIAALPLLPEYDEKIDLSYLGLYCRFFDWNEYASKDEKVLGKTLNKKKLAEVPILLPPLSVQKEIVARLEKELAAVDKMAKGFEAMKVEADQLFKINTKEILSNMGGEMKTWDDVFYTVTGKLDSNQAVEGGEYPFFTCSKEASRINNYAFDCEALLLAGNNAAGKYDVKHYSGKFNAYQRTYVLTLKQENWKYSFFQFQLENMLEYLRDKSKGTGTKYLTMGILRELKFKCPSVGQQDSIVAKLDAVREKCAKLKSAAEEGLKTAALMRKAILKEAFE